MRCNSLRRKTVLFLFAVLLTASWVSAGPRYGGAHPVRASEAVVIPDLLSWARSLLRDVWTKTGCQIDPFGRCLSGTSPVSSPSSSADAGCNIDPNGRCHFGSSSVSPADTGCQIDPNGGRCGS